MNNKKIDLHIHSDYSEDADLSVEEIFKLANDLPLSVISITDHDSINSIEKADSIKNKYSFIYIPGIEITTVFQIDNSQQHILGYFIDKGSQPLLDCLDKIVQYRKETAKKRIDAFRKLNFFLDEDKILETTGNRPAGPVNIISEIFRNEKNQNDPRLDIYLNGEKKNTRMASFYKDYLAENGHAYVPFKSVSTQEGINTIKKAGGIPILAHPIYVKNRDLLKTIKDMGIAGLEAVSTYHKPEDIEFYTRYATENDLLITAGSDFHGPTAKPHIKLGIQDGKADMNYSYYEKLNALYIKNKS